MEWFIRGLWIVMIALVGALQYAMPRLTRRDIFFAVTVAPEFRESAEARTILSGYRRGVVVITLIALAAAVVTRRIHPELLAP